MQPILLNMCSGRNHWVFGGSKLHSLTLTILVFAQTACVRSQTDTIRTIKHEAGVQSMSLLGANQAGVVNGKNRDLLLTNDAGKNWRVITSTSVGDGFESAFMLNENWGWAINRKGQVFNTKSAGQSWVQISEITNFTGTHQIQFLNERDGWLREFLGIWRTRDGGATWRKTLSTSTPGVYGQPSGMFLFDNKKVVAVGSGGQVYVTVDGGDNWEIRTAIAGGVNLEDVWFVDQEHGWLTGYEVLVAGEKMRPILLETNDGGYNWKDLSVEIDLLPSSVCAVGNELWLAGSRRIANRQPRDFSGVLLHSGDGGKHWDEIKFAIDEPAVKQVRFIDNKRGWLIAGDELYRTEDGGETWQQVLNLSNPV